MDGEKCICANCGRTFVFYEDFGDTTEQGQICDECFVELYGCCDLCGRTVPYFDYIYVGMENIDKVSAKVYLSNYVCRDCAKKHWIKFNEADSLIGKEYFEQKTKQIAEKPHRSMK